MSKKEIEGVNITKAKNGGYTIRNSYRRIVSKNSKAPSGIGYEYPESEEFVFGPGDGNKALSHVAQALGMGKGADEE